MSQPDTELVLDREMNAFLSHDRDRVREALEGHLRRTGAQLVGRAYHTAEPDDRAAFVDWLLGLLTASGVVPAAIVVTDDPTEV